MVRAIGRKHAIYWIVGVLAASIALVGGAALGGTVSGSGSTGKVNFRTSDVLLETPSSTFQNVTTMNVTTGDGPVVVRFDAQAYVNDFNADALFDGTHFAAMVVRVLLDGSVVPPGPQIRFTTNEGKRNVLDTHGQAASFSWATTVSSGTHTIKMQFRGLHLYDLSGLVRWTLTVDHN
jgi:hypothetical protein